MKKILTIISIGIALSITACEMPRMPTEAEIRQRVITMFKNKHGNRGKLILKVEREDDGYEYKISNGKEIEEIECSFWGQCVFD
jgi:hypothetical protein